MREARAVEGDPAEQATSTLLELKVLDNAYGFIEEGLKYALRAEQDEPAGWPFAIILAAQGIELLLKARLEREHPLLVQANPDKPPPGLTVTVDAAIKRLTNAGVTLLESDVTRLVRARRLRNDFMHYEVRATTQQLADSFADLLEFAHVFHLDHIGGELHDHLSEDVYPIEAEIMARFEREFITYQGSEIHKAFPSELVAAQFAPQVRLGDRLYLRIRRGWPPDRGSRSDVPCHDCSAINGQLHAWACDMEVCPICGGQMLGCDCDFEWEIADEIDHFTVPNPFIGSNDVADSYDEC